MWKTLSEVPVEQISENVNFFRFRQVGDKILITNMVGDFHQLTEDEFAQFLKGEIQEDSELYTDLIAKRFIKNVETVEDLKRVYRQLFQPKLFGPILHIMVVSKRCNHQCVYCHAAATTEEGDHLHMTIDTARQVVDTMFQSKAPAITLEFQGGEPLINWPVIEFSCQYARQKEKETGKKLHIQIISNMSLMDEEKMKYLAAHGVRFCTSLDGPKEIHNRNRIFMGKTEKSHDIVMNWIQKINDYVPDVSQQIRTVVATATKHTIVDHKSFIDFFVENGLQGVFIRSLNPMGFATRTWKLIGYSMDDFLAFYLPMVDYIIELNKKGVRFVDVMSKIMLMKILTDTDPNYVDLRSPCGAGVGQVAYNYTGEVYTCDDGRWFDEDIFKMGQVGEQTLSELLQTDVVANMVNATTNEGLYCDNCTYQPYCGICPAYNYGASGNIVQDLPNNDKCKFHKALFDHLFKRLQDPENLEVFKSWVFTQDKDVMTSLELSCSNMSN